MTVKERCARGIVEMLMLRQPVRGLGLSKPAPTSKPAGRAPLIKPVDQDGFRAKTALEPDEADRLIALALQVREQAFSRYGTISAFERELGFKRRSVLNACRPEPGRERSQLRVLERAAACLGVL